LQFTDEKDQNLSIPITIRGYHLCEADFVPKEAITDAQVWQGQKEQVLLLRLESTEKLLAIYLDGALVQRIPVGRQLDAIPLDSFTPGNYMLEIVDLASSKRRYYGMRL
jgi:hypothetical protein